MSNNKIGKVYDVSESIVRWFGLKIEGHPTAVEIAELSDGFIMISIVTKRDGLEPISTEMVLSTKTFSLLFDAMFRAAHGGVEWTAVKTEEYVKP